VLPLKKGIFLTAIESGVPIVPLGIAGTREMAPVGEWRIDPGLVRIKIGEPILIAGFGNDRVPELMERVRNQIRLLLHELLHELLGEPPGN
jgi:1-acyl-sn-glycerol-3-phosphate acyltransferase